MTERKTVDGSMALADEKRRVITIEASETNQIDKLRVAAYARVSSSSDDQLNSFGAQTRYYTKLITDKADWDLVDIYADATCIIGTNQSPNGWAAICPYFSCFQSIWRRHTR